MTIFTRLTRLLLCLSIALATPLGYAEDIDIYTRPPSATHDPSLNPNILVVIDNSANWAAANQGWPGGIKQGESELTALRAAIDVLDERTNVGLMMFTAGSGSNPSGGYIRFHVRPMTTANKVALGELIGDVSGCIDGANSLNGTPNCIRKNFNGSEKVASAKVDYSAVMLEVFKYFGGHTSPAHAQDNVADANVNSSQFGATRYAGDPDPKSDPYAFIDSGTTACTPTSTSAACVNKTNYNSPLSSANSCAKNYVIFIGNGFPSQDSPSTLLGPPSLLPTQGVGGDVTQLPLANLTSTTSTSSVLLATPGCGTFAGDTAGLSLSACLAKASKTVTIATGNPAVFTSTAHGLVAGDSLSLATTGALPNGLEPLTTYYVIASGLTADTFRLSLTAGGAAESASGSQSGTHTAAYMWDAYPGYETYSCTSFSECPGGSTTVTDDLIGTSACNVYSSTATCASETATAFPTSPNGTTYTSHYCVVADSACVSTPDNATNPIQNPSACIPAATAAACVDWANTNITNYTGFSCSGKTSCGGSTFSWVIDASKHRITGKTFDMHGSYTSTSSSLTYSQKIYGTHTVTAATPDGTFTAPASNKINYFDEWARFLHRTDVSSAIGQQNINTFTIDVFKDQQDIDQSALLISTATSGGGKYFKATEESAITNALKRIFSEIQSVNSVFASSSLPVSVNTQGTYLNQVFMGMFRPEGSAAPRWPGNLKQYKFGFLNGKLTLVDKNGEAAISTTTGFVTHLADSFWSTDTGRYWDFGTSLALGDCSAETSASPVAGSTSAYSDAPDGEVVEKGGAAQRLRGVTLSGTTVTTRTNYAECATGFTPATSACRNLFTCDGSSATSCTDLTGFITTNAGVSDSLSDDLIWWARGQDVDNENANTDGASAPIYNEMRPSVHGGVVHSQPAVVDFGGTIGTIAFYGADDGVFHAVDGGQTDTEGIELWGFIAPEIYSKFYRLRDNGLDSDADGTFAPLISFPGVTSTAPAPIPKDYFFDGSIGVHQKSGTVWIYPSMRRGGRAIYAFDVSTPTSPVMKWRKGCFTSDTTDDTVCSTGWSNIGQTWSTPHVVFLRGYVDGGGIAKPVLVFGGGYDQCEDDHIVAGVVSQTPECTGARKGAGIWFVDAATGDILRTYPTNYSVPGDVALIKDITTGYLNYVYAADSGGYVYRINAGTTDTTGTTFTSWTSNSAASQITLARLSETNHARKFLNGPSVVPTADYNAVLIGSGDREHPLVTDYACGNRSSTFTPTAGNYVANQFYMLVDTPTGYPSPAVTASDLVDVTTGTSTSVTASGTTTITNVSAGVTTTSTNGWKFNYGFCEQTVNEALTIGGSTFFGTNTPSSATGSSCVANLGIAKGYAVDFLTGMGSVAEYIGGGMPPSPVAGVVDVDGIKVPFCIGCIDPDEPTASALQGSKVEINPNSSRYRAYWYIEND